MRAAHWDISESCFGVFYKGFYAQWKIQVTRVLGTLYNYCYAKTSVLKIHFGLRLPTYRMSHMQMVPRNKGRLIKIGAVKWGELTWRSQFRHCATPCVLFSVQVTPPCFINCLPPRWCHWIFSVLGITVRQYCKHPWQSCQHTNRPSTMFHWWLEGSISPFLSNTSSR